MLTDMWPITKWRRRRVHGGMQSGEAAQGMNPFVIRLEAMGQNKVGEGGSQSSFCRPDAHEWRPLATYQEEAWLRRLPAFLSSADLAICGHCEAVRAVRESLTDNLFPSRHDLVAVSKSATQVPAEGEAGSQAAVLTTATA